MIDFQKKYKTQCGFPVRNLHWDMFAIDGEYFFAGNWYLGSWLDSGVPVMFTTDRKAISALSLVEISQISTSKNSNQIELNLKV